MKILTRTVVPTGTVVLKIILVFAFFLAPIAGRTLWYYRGVYQRVDAVSVPDYKSIQAPVPALSTSAPLRSEKLTRQQVVVFDMAHSSVYSLSEIQPLTSAIADLGARTEINNEYPSSYRQLRYADALVIIAPSYAFMTYELQAINEFVKRGGRLLVIADPTRVYNGSYYDPSYFTMSSTDIVNALLAPYDINMMDDYAYNVVENEGNFRNVILTDLGNTPLSDGISRVVLYAAHSFKSGNQVILRAGENTFSSLNDQGESLAMGALDASANVLALGDMTFMTSPFYQVADNHHFVQNIASFLTSGIRQLDLGNYPYLFSRPVTILTQSEKTASPEFVAALAKAQQGLKYINIPLHVASQPTEGDDLLVFALFEQNEQVKDYISEFKLEFSITPKPDSSGSDFGGGYLDPTPTGVVTPTPYDDPFSLTPTPTPYFYDGGYDSYGGGVSTNKDTVTVPGFGKLPADRIGLLLYVPGDVRNTLVMMAYDASSLSQLADLLTSGELGGSCTVQNNLAVCNVFSSSSGGYGY
jgi:hypothetical protein